MLTLFLPIESNKTAANDSYQYIISEFNAQSDTIEIRVDGLLSEMVTTRRWRGGWMMERALTCLL
ncbi:hypothetical protein [Clostridium sp. AM58-1XD]|uniref:hypothetical protein n=1 Tax=Clostridium sp. AM58-1XD TaxID=2292307 RepID=UPI000E540CF2|nr:hypothetical protein [Clostridium sp. AM58-1XD]RGY97944.1 hypothetical protein DXA13_12850 [Clostridium sp. AM58-1XD]